MEREIHFFLDPVLKDSFLKKDKDKDYEIKEIKETRETRETREITFLDFPEEKECYYVYILISCDKKRTYIGCTNNLKRRLRQHNGEIVGGARTTCRSGRPWSFFGFCSCPMKYLNRSEACRLETHWKRASYSNSQCKKKGKSRKSKYPEIENLFTEIEHFPKRIQHRLFGIQKACKFLSFSFQIIKS